MEYRTLELNIVSAKDIKDVNLLSKMDVYAVVSISGDPHNPQKKAKTPVHRDGGTNPTWNYAVKFSVNDALARQNRMSLEIKLFSDRTLGSDTLIGTVHIPIKELLDNPGDGAFRHVSYQVRTQSGKAKGSLNLSYKFGEKVNAPEKAAPAPAPAMAYPPHAAGYPPQASSYPPPAAAYPPQSSAYPPPAAAYPPMAAKQEKHESYPPPPASGSKQESEPVMAYPAGVAAGSSAGAAASYPPPPQHSYGYGYPPTQPGYGYPPPQQGYGYPPQPGYGYPPQQPGYGYPPAQMQQGKKKNKFGMGLGAGLLGGALGGLLIGDMVSDVAEYDAGYDAGFDDAGGFDF
ncbi:hypothetical protein RIF29_04011 [Crotalaria pallida]|uniref:C2 domain-containing protein n=1 Tax=Crotalaria pallida TaxID=3830 RepID=A0AAN9J1Y9_CROPI